MIVLPERSFCYMKNFAHQYSNLDYQSAWETIQSDLPELQNEVERILRQMETSS